MLLTIEIEPEDVASIMEEWDLRRVLIRCLGHRMTPADVALARIANAAIIAGAKPKKPKPPRERKPLSRKPTMAHADKRPALRREIEERETCDAKTDR